MNISSACRSASDLSIAIERLPLMANWKYFPKQFEHSLNNDVGVSSQ